MNNKAFLNALLTFLLLLFSTAPVADNPVPLVLSEDFSQPLSKHITLYHDWEGALDIAAIREADLQGKFHSAKTLVPGLGYHQGAWWVRFEIFNLGNLPRERWLESSWAHQQSVDAYFISHASGEISRYQSGSRVALAERPLPSREVLFPLTFAPEEKVTVYLRFSGNAATVVDLSVWQPAAYADHGRLSMSFRYLGVSALMIFLIFSVMAWKTLKKPLLIFGAISDILLICFVFISDGYLFDTLFPAGADSWQLRFMSFLMFLIITSHILFASEFLELSKLRSGFDRLAKAVAIFSLLYGIWALVDLNLMMADMMQQFFACTMAALAVYSSFREARNANIYLLAWGVLWLSFGLRIIGMYGFFPGFSFYNSLPLAGLGISSLILSYALLVDITRVRTEVDHARKRLIEHQALYAQRLESSVAERTHDLEEARLRAEKAVQAKSTFISIINHELRTPLHTILGNAHLLKIDIPPSLKQKVDRIEISGKQLLRLINDLLDCSKGEAEAITLKNEMVDLLLLMKHLKEDFQSTALEHKNQLIFNIPENIPRFVSADVQRLTQVLQNLIGNACKYTQEGSIVISVKRKLDAQPDERQVTLCFMVEDTGIGVNHEEIETIFEPFGRAYKTHHYPGLGLGLAIARQLIHAMGSEISVASTPGVGSRFSFQLKFQLGEYMEGSTTESCALRIIGYQGPRKSVLIVDDSTENLEFLETLLHQWGFTLLMASDGSEALNLCRSGRIAIDCVLVDQFMPHVDGWDLLHILRNSEDTTLNALPVILVTATTSRRPTGYPENLTFDDVLMKPVLVDDLAKVLEKHLSLSWIVKELVDSEADPTPIHFPPKHELVKLHEYLKSGKIIFLQKAAEALLPLYPQCHGFISEVKRLCELIDIRGLDNFLSQK